VGVVGALAEVGDPRVTASIACVILEPGGAADPGGIVMTFLDGAQREARVLDRITCVVDAGAILRDADDESVSALWGRRSPVQRSAATSRTAHELTEVVASRAR